jgi:hypothetical protein
METASFLWTDCQRSPALPSPAAASWRGGSNNTTDGVRITCHEYACDRKVENGLVRRESVDYLRARRASYTDASKCDLHGLEVPAMGFVDVAVAVFLIAQPLRRPGSDRYTNI